MATTTKTLEIGLTRTTDSSGLFEDTDGANVQASMERFDEMLLAEITALFPEADVQIVDRGYVFDLTAGHNANPEDTTAAGDAWRTVRAIADRLHSDGAWIVEAE